MAVLLALGASACASKRETHRAKASNGQSPWFQTASIKRNDVPATEISAVGNKFVAIEPAINMIVFAYGRQRPLSPIQVLGGPHWINTEVFNIQADLPQSLSDQLKPPFFGTGPYPIYPVGVRRADAIKQVFRSLLIGRFKLRIRHETKMLPVFELVLAKNRQNIAEDKTAGGSCRITDVGPEKGPWLDVNSCDFRNLVQILAAGPALRSKVLVDETRLHGRYSFKIHLTPGTAPGTRMPTTGNRGNHEAEHAEPPASWLFTMALLKELGLRVQPARARVDTIVIEHIENPAKN